jgi:hypothetical protein
MRPRHETSHRKTNTIHKTNLKIKAVKQVICYVMSQNLKQETFTSVTNLPAHRGNGDVTSPKEHADVP